jgi:hypothetical protein
VKVVVLPDVTDLDEGEIVTFDPAEADTVYVGAAQVEPFHVVPEIQVAVGVTEFNKFPLAYKLKVEELYGTVLVVPALDEDVENCVLPCLTLGLIGYDIDQDTEVVQDDAPEAMVQFAAEIQPEGS